MIFVNSFIKYYITIINSKDYFLAKKIYQAMDFNVDPCVDFYKFACGRVAEVKNNVHAHADVQRDIDKEIQMIVEEPISKNEMKIFTLVKKLYKMCMNNSKLSLEGLDSLQHIFEKFGGWPILENDRWNETNLAWIDIAENFMKHTYNADFLFEVEAGGRLENNSDIVLFVRMV